MLVRGGAEHNTMHALPATRPHASTEAAVAYTWHTYAYTTNFLGALAWEKNRSLYLPCLSSAYVSLYEWCVNPGLRDAAPRQACINSPSSTVFAWTYVVQSCTLQQQQLVDFWVELGFVRHDTNSSQIHGGQTLPRIQELVYNK